MVDLREDKKGYDNPLVDAESGAIKHSQVSQSPTADQEKSNLQKNFGMPSATKEDIDSNQPDNQRKADKDDFAPSMNDVTASALASVTKGKFLGKFNINITNKQKAGGAGLFVGLILLILGLISLGPLQFIHMSQLLSQFHFSKQNDLTDNRFRKMMRYMRNPDRPDRSRLGVLANKSADKLTAKLAEKGIKPVYGTGGYSTGFEVDVNKMKNDADFGRLIVGDGDNDATRANIANEFGGKYDKNGLLVPDGNDYFKDKKFTKQIVKMAGLEGKIFPTKARRLNIRGGNSGLFHPIKKSAAKKIDEIIAARKEKLKIKDGESTPITTNDKDADGKPVDPNNGSANEVVKDANSIKADAKTGGFSEMPKWITPGNAGKAALGALSITGLTCLFDSLSSSIYDAQAANVLTPLMNAGVESIAIGNQVMSGDDIDLLTLGAYSTNLYSKDYGSWENAESIQANLGNKNKGTPQPAEAALNVENNAALKFFEEMKKGSVFGAEGSISTICHPISQGGALVVSLAAAFFTGGATAGAKIASVGVEIGKAAASMVASGIAMEQVEKAIVAEPINVLNYHGGQFGSLVDSGAFLAGNEAFLDSGGQLLSSEQTAELAKNQQYVLRQEKKQRSIYDKYINPVKYDSAVAQLMDDQSYNPAKTFSSIPTDFLSSFSDSFKNLASVFSPQLYAQNNTTGAATYTGYGLPYAGFNQSQIDNPIVDNPEENYENAVKLINNQVKFQDDTEYTYKQLFKECNNLNVNDDLSSTPENKDQSSQYQSNPTAQDSNSKGIETLANKGRCGDPKDEDLLRLRFAIFDMQTAEAAACQLGDEEACTSLGVTQQTSANADCPPGTSSDPTSSGIAGKIYWPLESGDKFASDGGHDFANGGVPIGTPVHAITDGTVIESKDMPGCDGRNCGDGMQSYGRLIKIDHGGKVGTINYAHFSKRMVEKGDKVVAGQIIGLSGNAGNSSGPHLHIDSNPAETAIALLKSLNAEKPPKSVGAATPSSSTSCTTGTPGVYKDPIRDVKSFTKSRVDPGVDFASLPTGSVIHPLGNATIIEAGPSGGWSGYFTRYKLENGPAKGLNVYMAHKCKPKVKKGDKVTADTVLCTIEGGDYIETGWAAEDAGTTMSEASREASCNTYGHEDPYGTNFYEFLKSQGFKNAVQTAPKTSNYDSCKVPAKYPTWK